jgi:DNA-binding transcriptional ArsR family regulator/YHS domain-containing protein
MYKQVFQLHSDLLKAMSHPKRLEIIHLLRDQKLSVGQIQTMLDLPQANLSQHLMILREAEIVSTTREGKQIYYQLSHSNIIKASDALRQILIEKHQGEDIAKEMTRKMTDLVPLVHDPVCHMRLSPKTAGFACKYQGQTYYFCASGCLREFEKDPGKYL